MIDGLKPYPAYKDTGVPWLGEVPVHWEVRKLKYAVSFSGGGTPSKAEASFWGGRIPWVSPKDMTRARIADSMDHITEEAVSASATSIVSPGALLMVVRSGILRRTIPVAINVVEVALNQDMKALRPRAGVVTSDYLRALVQGNEGALIQEWTKQGATVESIEHEFLANSRVPLPPLPEQAAIVRFLDYVDRRIRRYIRAKQKLIKLLEEQKQAIIHRAVTRGLDPNVRLKPSGVEWLGDVPEHWEVRKLGSLFQRRGSGTTPSGDHYYGGEIPWVMTGDLNDGLVNTTKRTVTNAAVQELSALQVYQRGALIVAMYGATIGKTGVLLMEACTNQACCVLAEPSESVSVGFLQAVVKVAKPHLIEQSYGGGQPNINAEIVRALRVPVPPRSEQEEILRAIAEHSGDSAMIRAAREIELIREYRTRLIADVVTGKLDVREAAMRLPDEGEPLDEIESDVEADEAGVDDTDEVPEEAEA